MSKCQICEYYSYHCGIAPSLSKMLGINVHNRPTCYCNYAGVAWERYSAEVRKPAGIKCNFVMREMTCEKCGKKLKSASDVWLILTAKSYICKKCGKKVESEAEHNV